MSRRNDAKMEERRASGSAPVPKALAAVGVDLRPKNQMTLPASVAQLLGVAPGDRLLLEVEEGEPREVRLRRIRASYAGALSGVYGTPEEAADELRREREAWEG